VQLEDFVTVLRYRDQPGMLGRIGTVLGDAGVNIVSAAVGYHSEGGSPDGSAVMVVATDNAVPESALNELLASEGFEAARSVAFG